MQIDLAFDDSVKTAPVAFVDTLNAVAAWLDAAITTPVSVTISVGWGEIDGAPVANGGAESQSDIFDDSYAGVRSALLASGSSAADAQALATLPVAAPSGLGTIELTGPQAAAIGLAGDGQGAIRLAGDGQGWIGFDPVVSWTYGANVAPAGGSDLWAVAVHEITEVLGRVSDVGSTAPPSVLDLFRYTSPGLRALAPAQSAHFSIDGGTTDLADFNTVAGGDTGDWASDVVDDSFDAFGGAGVANTLSRTDLTVMDVLGYTLAIPGSVPPPGIVGSMAGQSVAAGGTITPFAGVTLTDPNTGRPETLTVTPSDASNGSLADLGGGSDASGVYTVTGTLAAVTADLQGLVFVPAAGTPGSVRTTNFTVSLGDGVALATDATTSVIATTPAAAVPATDENASATLPDLSASLAAPGWSALNIALVRLDPAGTAINAVTIAGGAAAPSAMAGAFNALVVTSASSGASIVLPSGYRALYMSGGSGATAVDAQGGALIADTAGNATVIAAAEDTVIGGNGAQTLCGTSGAETLMGGTGTTLFALGGADADVTSIGTDTILGGGAETVNAGASDALLFAGTGPLAFNAGTGMSTVVGGAAGSTINGGAGATLYFAHGPTLYMPGSAVDTIVGGTGSLTAGGGTAGSLVFTGTAGNSLVSTGSGAATIVGLGAHDRLVAIGAGPEMITTMAASSTIDGAQASGISSYAAFGANDLVVGGAGPTSIASGLGNQTLVAGTGATVFDILPGTADRAITIETFDATRDQVSFASYGAGPGLAAAQTIGISHGSEVIVLEDGSRITFADTTGLPTTCFI